MIGAFSCYGRLSCSLSLASNSSQDPDKWNSECKIRSHPSFALVRWILPSLVAPRTTSLPDNQTQLTQDILQHGRGGAFAPFRFNIRASLSSYIGDRKENFRVFTAITPMIVLMIAEKDHRFTVRATFPVKMPCSIHVLPQTMSEACPKASTSPHSFRMHGLQERGVMQYKAATATGLPGKGPKSFEALTRRRCRPRRSNIRIYGANLAAIGSCLNYT